MDARSRALRRRIVEVLEKAGRGHVGSSLSLVEIMRVLFDDIARYDPARPDWPDRDRIILSKGHGCLALYVMLADKGFFPVEELWRFCNVDGILGGHPEAKKIPGVEASPGALGHGLSIGMGMALAGKIDRRPYRVFVVTGDGEINEGAVWEAALSAAKHKLSNLTLLIDYNKMQSYGPTRDILDLEPLADKWKAFRFATVEVDGHDVAALRDVLQRVPLAADRPTVIICHTVKGKGISFAEGNAMWHHKNSFKDNEIADMYRELEAV
ncbi:MAG: transketolase [Hyphomicrobiales bacterium]|nr:transketolase [Hyphomicrobiales bacterium]